MNSCQSCHRVSIEHVLLHTEPVHAEQHLIVAGPGAWATPSESSAASPPCFVSSTNSITTSTYSDILPTAVALCESTNCYYSTASSRTQTCCCMSCCCNSPSCCCLLHRQLLNSQHSRFYNVLTSQNYVYTE